MTEAGMVTSLLLYAYLAGVIGAAVGLLEAFVGPCPSGQEACHANDDPRDNRLENLRWDTRSANALDSVRNGTHHAARRTHCAQGHEFTAINTYRYPSGKRSCVVCRRASNSRRKAA